MMLKLFLLCLAAKAVVSQIDPTFCQLTPDPANLPFPNQDNNIKYTAEIERNEANKKYTEEIKEYYDGASNIGVSINTNAGVKTQTISDDKNDELLLIYGYECSVLPLRANIKSTPFYVIDANGTEHIATGLGYLTKKGVNFTFLGLDELRGIPTKKWGSCAYDKNSNSTLKFIVSYSDDEKWTPAVVQPGFKSIPLEITVESENMFTNAKNTVVDIITRFRVGEQIDEEVYFVGPGVYCEGSKNQLAFPKIPDTFSAWVQYSVPNIFNSTLEGSLRTYRIEHDFPRKLYRLDYYINSQRYTEIHDDNTGLIYALNKFQQTCEIRTIADLNSDSEPQSAAILFETSQNPPYQYSGSRRVRGINTNVWIAPRVFNNDKCTWEWHFMTDQWVSQETNAVKTNEPVLLNIFYPKGFNQKARLQFHFTQFDQSRIDLYDYDISTCQRNIENKHVRFTINSDSYKTFKVNQAAFKDALITAVQKDANISLLRIGRLNTIYDQGSIYAVMTIFERPSKYGPVPVVPQENNLNGAYESLKKKIDDGNFKFTVSINKQDIVVTADPESLIDLDENSGRFYYVNVVTGETVGYTSGSVVGFVIGFLIVGLVAGFGVGFFFVIKRNALSNVTGFLNPMFNKQAGASA